MPLLALPSALHRKWAPPVFTLFENANVYAPEPLGVKNVLIANGKIAWIGDGPLDLVRNST